MPYCQNSKYQNFMDKSDTAPFLKNPTSHCTTSKELSDIAYLCLVKLCPSNRFCKLLKIHLALPPYSSTGKVQLANYCILKIYMN